MPKEDPRIKLIQRFLSGPQSLADLEVSGAIEFWKNLPGVKNTTVPITPELANAIEEWIMDSSEINKALRLGIPITEFPTEVSLWDKMTRLHTMPTNLQLWRGMDLRPEMVPGYVYTDPGYFTTSPERSTALSFIHGKNPALMEIEGMVKGNPGVYIPNLQNLKPVELESEITFPRGAQITIKDIQDIKPGSSKIVKLVRTILKSPAVGLPVALALLTLLHQTGDE